jgi:hypothetical protein
MLTGRRARRPHQMGGDRRVYNLKERTPEAGIMAPLDLRPERRALLGAVALMAKELIFQRIIDVEEGTEAVPDSANAVPGSGPHTH